MLGNDRMLYRRGASQSATFIVAASDSLHQGYADYVCDGVDDQVEIQAAIDALPTNGGSALLLEGNYNVSARISLDNLDNVSLFSYGNAILNKPDEVKSLLTVDAVAGEYTITVSDTTGFRVGAMISVADTAYRGNNTTYGVITDITGNVITIDTALQFAYSVAHDAKALNSFNVIYVGDSSNCLVSGIVINGNISNRPTLEDFGSAGILIDGGYGCKVKDCYLYALASDGICEGASYNTIIQNNVVEGSTYAYPSGKGIHFGGDTYNILVANNVVRNCRVGVYFCLHSYGAVVTGNILDSCTEYGIEVQLNGVHHEASISNNTIYSAGTYGILVSPGNNSLTITANTIYSSGDIGIEIESSGVAVVGNVVEDTTTHGIVIYDTDDIVVSNNILKNWGINTSTNSYGIFVYENVTNCSVTNNILHITSDEDAPRGYIGIVVGRSSVAPIYMKCTVSNNVIENPVQQGISIASSGITVLGNIIGGTNATYPSMLLHGQAGNIDNIIVADNVINATDVDNVAIEINAAVIGALIHSNAIVNATTGIVDNGVNTKLWQNVGHITENSGTATIANTTTSITVDHGLNVTPSAGDIVVTPITAWGSMTSFYIDTYTSGQFTIHANTDPGADVDFAWKAIVL